MDCHDGLALSLVGGILTATFIGAIIGIPLLLVGGVLMYFCDCDDDSDECHSLFKGDEFDSDAP